MKQPISTITNIAYGVAAILCWPYSVPTAIALIVLMFGSGWYHWTLSEEGRCSDHASMYFVFSMMGGYAIGGQLGAYLLLACAFLYFAIPLFVRRSWPKTDMRVAIGVLFVPNLIAIWLAAGFESLVYVVLTFLVILIMRDAADQRFGRMSDHISHEVIHGSWHVWTAAAIYWMVTLL